MSEPNPIKSSMFSAINYNPDTAESGTMELTFKNGTVYRYANVPPEVYAEFMASESLGKFFAAMIRNVYRAERVDPADPEGTDERSDL
jgi:hypothetical protein